MTQRKILMKILGAIGSDFGLFSQLIISSEDESVLTSFVVVVQSLSHVWLFVTPIPHHGLQNVRLPCPLLFPRVCSNSCPLNGGCHPTISSCCPLILLPSIFPSMSVFSNESVLSITCQSIGASASASVFPVNIQGWFALGLTGLVSLLSKRLSRIFTSTTIGKHQFFGVQLSLQSSSHIHTWLLESHSFAYNDFCQQSDVSAF